MNIHWMKTTCLVGVIGLFEITGACSWTPQIETELHNSSQGMVSLRTIGEDALVTDHPVEIQKATMERVLRGAHKFRDPRLIETLITDSEKPKHLFSHSQITFLAPLLAFAFAQATPEEKVVFQCASEYEGAPPIKGSMLVHESTLFFTWNEPLSKPHVLAKQHRETTGLMDPSMPQGHLITFFPHEAIRIETNSTKYYKKRLGENTLAINYSVLGGLPKTVFETPEALNENEEVNTQTSGRQGEEESGSEERPSAEPITTGTSQGSNAEAVSPPSSSDAESDIRALREKMDQLQKEMEKQQEELDRLKKNNP